MIGEYLAQVVAAKLDAGELAVVYGHPERRLGRMPEVLTTLARAIEGEPLVWRTTFSELARWWRWRAERRWLVIPRDDHRLEIQFDEWDTEYRPRARDPPRPVPLLAAGDRARGCRCGLADLAYERTRRLRAERDRARRSIAGP